MGREALDGHHTPDLPSRAARGRPAQTATGVYRAMTAFASTSTSASGAASPLT
jgi:hypothetical protein